MIQQSDLDARLRLFRYGLVVLVVVAFLISLLVHVVSYNALIAGLGDLADDAPSLMDVALGNTVLITVGVAVIAVIAYVVYYYLLKRSLPLVGGDQS